MVGGGPDLFAPYVQERPAVGRRGGGQYSELHRVSRSAAPRYSSYAPDPRDRGREWDRDRPALPHSQHPYRGAGFHDIPQSAFSRSYVASKDMRDQDRDRDHVRLGGDGRGALPYDSNRTSLPSHGRQKPGYHDLHYGRSDYSRHRSDGEGHAPRYSSRDFWDVDGPRNGGGRDYPHSDPHFGYGGDRGRDRESYHHRERERDSHGDRDGRGRKDFYTPDTRREYNQSTPRSDSSRPDFFARDRDNQDARERDREWETDNRRGGPPVRGSRDSSSESRRYPSSSNSSSSFNGSNMPSAPLSSSLSPSHSPAENNNGLSLQSDSAFPPVSAAARSGVLADKLIPPLETSSQSGLASSTTSSSAPIKDVWQGSGTGSLRAGKDQSAQPQPLSPSSSAISDYNLARSLVPGKPAVPRQIAKSRNELLKSTSARKRSTEPTQRPSRAHESTSATALAPSTAVSRPAGFVELKSEVILNSAVANTMHPLSLHPSATANTIQSRGIETGMQNKLASVNDDNLVGDNIPDISGVTASRKGGEASCDVGSLLVSEGEDIAEDSDTAFRGSSASGARSGDIRQEASAVPPGFCSSPPPSFDKHADSLSVSVGKEGSAVEANSLEIGDMNCTSLGFSSTVLGDDVWMERSDVLSISFEEELRLLHLFGWTEDSQECFYGEFGEEELILLQQQLEEQKEQINQLRQERRKRLSSSLREWHPTMSLKLAS